MSDITGIFLTQNEVPEEWAAYHRAVLLESLEGAPLITMSRKPMAGLGLNIIQDRERSTSNIYRQLLIGCKHATTDYVAVVEDDTLYPREHFLERPPKGTVGYNMNFWHLFTWDKEPIYSWRNRRGNYSMLSDRLYVIDALEERFAKWPDGTPERMTGEIGRPMVEHNLNISERVVHEFETTVAVVNFQHKFGSDEMQRNQRKRAGLVRAYDVPHWGRAEGLIKHFR